MTILPQPSRRRVFFVDKGGSERDVIVAGSTADRY